MARVTYVKKARMVPIPEKRRCVSCGHIVHAGESYKRVGLKIGPYSSITRNWCQNCTPKQSQLTTNDRLSRLYEIEEGLSADIANTGDTGLGIDDLKSSFESAADSAEEIADEYEESVDNMPENLRQGSQADEMRDKAQAIRDWAEELRSVMDDADEVDPDKCATCGGDRDADAHIEDEGLTEEEQQTKESFDHDFEEPEALDLSSVEIPMLSL